MEPGGLQSMGSQGVGHERLMLSFLQEVGRTRMNGIAGIGNQWF